MQEAAPWDLSYFTELSSTLRTGTLGPLLLQMGLSPVSHTGRRDGTATGSDLGEKTRPSPAPAGLGVAHLLTENRPQTSSMREAC